MAYGIDEFNIPAEAFKFAENKDENKQQLFNRYNHVFGDVEHNTSRSGKSYYETHHRNKSKGRVDIEGDVTNLRNNSIILTERNTKFNNEALNEEEKKKYFSSNSKNLIYSSNTNNQKDNSKGYNFNSNLFIEEQKLRSSKEMNSNFYI